MHIYSVKDKTIWLLPVDIFDFDTLSKTLYLCSVYYIIPGAATLL